MKIKKNLDLTFLISGWLTAFSPKNTPKITQKHSISAYRRLSKQVLLTVVFSFIAVASFNFIVNPYGVFDSVISPKINRYKPKQLNNDRLFKATEIIHFKPTTILLGSSRVRQGLNPNHPALQQNSPIYNLGLNDGSITELRQYLEHSLVNNPNLTTVVLGIDYFMFDGKHDPPATFDQSRLQKNYLVPKDLLNTLFSLTALWDSQETLLTNLKSSAHQTQQDYGKLGFFPDLNSNREHTQWNFQNTIELYLESYYDPYPLSSSALNEFRQIVKLCQEKNIELTVFISPAHALHWETVAITGEWNLFEQWKREIVKITPVWDFSGYNSVTSEPLHTGMKHYTDGSHYTPFVGDLVLNRLFDYKLSSVPPDFGVLISENNIETHLQMIRENRKKWRNSQPQALAFLQQIKDNWDAQK